MDPPKRARLIPWLALFFAWAGQRPWAYVLELDSIQGRIPCTDKILVMREKGPDQLFLYNDRGMANYSRLDSMLARPLYGKFEDNFDFLMLMPQFSRVENQAAIIYNQVSGIGPMKSFRSRFAGFSNRLQMTFDSGIFYLYYLKKTEPQAQTDLRYEVNAAMHELGHRWCCNLKGFYQNPQTWMDGHWHYGMQLFGTDTTTMDPLAYVSWVSDGERWTPVQINDHRETRRFSELSQYLMGLRPPEEVRPFKVHWWDTTGQTIDPGSNLPISGSSGPAAFQAPLFLGSRTMTAEDVAAVNGKREPAYPNTQRHFNLLPIILVPYGEELERDHLPFIDSVMKAMPPAWSAFTEGRSTLRMGCDLDLETRRYAKASKAMGVRYMPRERALAVDLPGAEGWVEVELYDLRGRKVKTLFRGRAPADRFDIPLRDGPGSGGYQVLLRRGEESASARIVIL